MGGDTVANDEQDNGNSYVASGFPPRGKAQLSLDELYAYEPDRESSERQRIFGSTSGTLGGYYREAREREERSQGPVRHREP